jgi:hypothetical protein
MRRLLSGRYPDLHSPELDQEPSRRRSPVGSYFRGQGGHSSRDRSISPPPRLSNTLHTLRENRLLSELWLTSAATFRRMGRLDEAKRAIMEAEVLDETNPNVWVQVRSPDNVLRG